jgi:hypothetical protein
MACCDWSIPLWVDKASGPLNLKEMGWSRSDRTRSVSDLTLAVRSRSNSGRGT